ncbi:MAG: Holliday junction branch migration protein RuvA [Gammaproteobacteria bacterium]|nr:Holliday junction branch migration protein RuvA [Gammaproteobacteria bacterium]
MIGRLNGLLAIKRAPQILIDCQGVGYEVDVSMSTFYQLPEEGKPVSIWTHLLIKDDQHALIGFFTDQERKLFRLLIKVNGVGPKMALTILSGISETDFALCIQSSDVATLVRLPGVGKKTAERLIIEMRDKVEGLNVDGVSSAGDVGASSVSKTSSQSEAVEALQSLGYKPADASKMVNTIAKSNPDSSAESLIKLALQNAIS